MCIRDSHWAGRLDKIGFVDAVALFLLEDGINNELSYLFTRFASPEAVADVVIHHREQAGPEIAVCSQSQPRTRAAEGHSHRSDNPYLARRAILKPVSYTHLTLPT